MSVRLGEGEKREKEKSVRGESGADVSENAQIVKQVNRIFELP